MSFYKRKHTHIILHSPIQSTSCRFPLWYEIAVDSKIKCVLMWWAQTQAHHQCKNLEVIWIDNIQMNDTSPRPCKYHIPAKMNYWAGDCNRAKTSFYPHPPHPEHCCLMSGFSQNPHLSTLDIWKWKGSTPFRQRWYFS